MGPDSLEHDLERISARLGPRVLAAAGRIAE